MKRLLILLLFLFTVTHSWSQMGYLFVKKGVHKVRTWSEGDRIMLRTKDYQLMSGIITLLRNDTIWLNGMPVARTAVTDVLLSNRHKKTFQVDAGELLLITGGVALVVTGLTLSHQAKFGEAVIAGTVIGYGQVLMRYLGSKISLKRKRYKIGSKFRLSMMEFHLPVLRPF